MLIISRLRSEASGDLASSCTRGKNGERLDPGRLIPGRFQSGSKARVRAGAAIRHDDPSEAESSSLLLRSDLLSADGIPEAAERRRTARSDDIGAMSGRRCARRRSTVAPNRSSSSTFPFR